MIMGRDQMTDFPGVYQWPTYFHEANDSAVLS